MHTHHCFPASSDAESGREKNGKWYQRQRSAINEPRRSGRNVVSGSLRAHAELSHKTDNLVCGLNSCSIFPSCFQCRGTSRGAATSLGSDVWPRTWRRKIICASSTGRKRPPRPCGRSPSLLAAPRGRPSTCFAHRRQISSYHPGPVQPGPDPTALSAEPSHLLSITPQTNWTVTPLSGPRLHFSSHRSLPKTVFLLHCDIFDSPLPRICAAFLTSTPSSLFMRPSTPVHSERLHSWGLNHILP